MLGLKSVFERTGERMATTGIDTYRTVRTTTADPITLTTMLFDGAVKAMRKARICDEQGKREGFIEELERAQLIVGELLCSLDMEQGEIPRNLNAIYTYCLRCLIEASLGDLVRLDEAERQITRIALAWKEATAQLRASGQSPSIRRETAA